MFSSVHEIAIGVITSFSGGLGNIPPGWVLCDGNNGTPDLRNKFIVGTGPTFSVDDESSVLTHTHPFTSDGHDHTTQAGAALNAGGDLDNTSTIDKLDGRTDIGISLPPTYALAYIMYIGP